MSASKSIEISAIQIKDICFLQKGAILIELEPGNVNEIRFIKLSGDAWDMLQLEYNRVHKP